jgi:hypothetical protein
MLKLVVKLGAYSPAYEMDHHSSKELFHDARLHIKSSYTNQSIHQIARGQVMISKGKLIFLYRVIMILLILG